MDIAAARQSSVKHVTIVRPVITQNEMIGRINEALKAYDSFRPSLSDDRVGQSLSRVANYFKQVVDAEVESRKKPGINVLAALKPAKNELSGLFGLRASGMNPVAADVHETFTRVLDGTAFSIREFPLSENALR